LFGFCLLGATSALGGLCLGGAYGDERHDDGAKPC
jgi:hypothetical protein